MPEITAALVKELRDATNLGMMECKKALVETDGDKDKAIRILRERGLAIAEKKASRAANQGLVASTVKEDPNIASLIEVNCETDFVSKNDGFIAFVNELADKACDTDGYLAETEKSALTEKIAEIGENLVIKRNTRFVLKGTGQVASYIHLGGKIGVLVDIACEKPETVGTPGFDELVKDVTMHICASSPPYLTSDEVPEDVLASEKAIYAKQVEGKPAEILDKIIDGKVRKFYTEVCLLEQPFVKEPKISVSKHLEANSKELGDTISIKRFVRYQMGEE